MSGRLFTICTLAATIGSPPAVAAVRIEPLVRKAAEALLLVAAVEARLLRIGSGACGLALGRKTWLRRASTW